MRVFLFFITLLSGFYAGMCSAATPLRVLNTYNRDGIASMMQQFSAQSGIEVQIEYIDQEELKATVLKRMELHNPPDMLIMPADHVGMFKFMKYSAFKKSIFKANVPASTWEMGITEGKLYAAPIVQGTHLVLFYNKGLVSHPAQNWQEMGRQQLRFNASGVTTILWQQASPYWFLPFLDAFGGWPMNNGKIELNTPAMVAAINYYDKLGEQFLPRVLCNNDCIFQAFKARKVAYIISGAWDSKLLFKELGDQLGVAPLPEANGKPMRSPFSTYVVAFPDNSLEGVKRAALIELTNYLQSTAVQKQLWEKLGAIPVEPNAIAYAKKNSKGYAIDILNQLKYTRPLPSDSAMSFSWEPIQKGLARHRENALDAENAAQYMQKLAERNVKNAAAEADTKVP